MSLNGSPKKSQETINELNKKLLVLKNALLEERKKTNKLEDEVKNLNDKILEKDELIFNYKNENENLNNEINKINLNKENENDSNNFDKDTLEKENKKLKNELSVCKDQNDVFKLKIELLTNEIENIKKESINEIEKLKKNLEKEKKTKEENHDKYNELDDFSKKLNLKKKDYENNFSQLLKTNKDLEERINILTNNNKEITIQNKIFEISISQLKNQIESMGDENYILNKELDDKKNINKDYIFKGTFYIDEKKKNKKQIKLCFGKYENRIEIMFEGEITRNIQIKNVTSIKKIEGKKGYIIISYFEGKEKIKLFCQFTERECEYIIKFFKEIKGNLIENKQKVMMMSLNIDNFAF